MIDQKNPTIEESPDETKIMEGFEISDNTSQNWILQEPNGKKRFSQKSALKTIVNLFLILFNICLWGYVWTGLNEYFSGTSPKVPSKIEHFEKKLKQTVNPYGAIYSLILNKKYEKALEAFNRIDRPSSVDGDYEGTKKVLEYIVSMENAKTSFKNKQIFDAINYLNQANSINTTDYFFEKKSEELKVNLLAYQSLKKQIANSIQIKKKNAFNELRKKHDPVENLTWYFDRHTKDYVENDMSLYFSIKDDQDVTKIPNLRLRPAYTGEDWIFFEDIIFNIDGKKYTITPASDEIHHDNDTEVYEWADIPMESIESRTGIKLSSTNLNILGRSSQSEINELKEIIKKIVDSKKTLIRFSGKNNYDREISSQEKQGMRNVMDAYILAGGKF